MQEEQPDSSARRAAVVGGGISSLTAAAELAAAGCQVDVFDKARGPGGRTSIRRAAIAGRDISFPHGTTLFTATEEGFEAQAERWRAAGVVDRYAGRIASIDATGHAREVPNGIARYVGTPGMNAICKYLVATPGITFHAQHVVARVEPSAAKVTLVMADDEIAAGYDLCVVGCPAPQAAVLIRDSFPAIAEKADAVEMLPTWAAMLAWEPGEEPVDFDAAFVRGGDVAWLFQAAPAAWVVHMTHDWTLRHLEEDKNDVAQRAAEIVGPMLRRQTPPIHAAAHRWRYVAAKEPVRRSCLVADSAPVAVCGDWLLGDTIGFAWQSGRAAARELLMKR